MWIPLHRQPSFASKSNKAKKENSELDPMAHLMKNPNTEKLQCENVEVNGMNIGHASMQGYRVSMEDEHIIETFESLPDHTLVAIMDGEPETMLNLLNRLF